MEKKMSFKDFGDVVLNMSLYHYEDTNMWKSFLNSLERVGGINEFDMAVLAKDIVACYSLSCAIMNTPNDEKVLMEMLRRKYSESVEQFGEDMNSLVWEK